MRASSLRTRQPRIGRTPTMMTSNWHVATVVSGMDFGGLATGARVVFRIVAGHVQVIGHGRITAVLTIAAARQALETVRVGRRQCKPMTASRQTYLGILWDRLRESRRFSGIRAKLAA